ncbi:MAG TPA: hypothetical protein VKV40_06740 [Ktedonobacteraceae bacterium]|nr:hypothetical protein [Ktedonobacteraceae bacterium]
MATFEKRDFPEISRTAYLITDDYGHTAELTLAQANHLLEWLYQQRDELYRLTHQALEQATPWYEETPAEFLAGFDEIIEVHRQGQQRGKPEQQNQDASKPLTASYPHPNGRSSGCAMVWMEKERGCVRNRKWRLF